MNSVKPLKWHGGKFYLALRYRARFPEHTHYVETHFGGGSLLLSGDGEGVSEVANDKYGLLMNFYRVLRDPEAFEEFKRTVEATPICEDFWREAADVCFRKARHRIPPIPNVHLAVQFFIFCRQSRQGLMEDFASISRNRVRRGMNEQASAWWSAVEGLDEIHHRLRRVVMFSRDGADIIRREDSPSTFFFVDPPYPKDTRKAPEAYEYEMSQVEHRHLLETLSQIKGKFMLCGYQNRLYDGFWRDYGWTLEKFDIDNKSSGSKTKERKVECIWMNYRPPGYRARL